MIDLPDHDCFAETDEAVDAPAPFLPVVLGLAFAFWAVVLVGVGQVAGWW